ncbi:unnamed protein product [Hapterophycus canaliculatus]
MKKSSVKFGLIGTASSLKKGASGGKARPIGSKPAPRRRPPGATSVFDANSDDEDGPTGDVGGVAAVNKRLAAISAKQEKQAKKEYEDALEADPSVFDYDRVYDGMKESRDSNAAAATVAREKEKRQPKYIGNLLKQAKMRAVESDRIFDRKLQKEREEQDKLEGEATMKFVTSAFKKKLMEQKKWELQQQLEEERETRNDVTKTGMSGFYSNLITKNIAMGGDVEKSANSAFTAGSKRHAATAEYEMQDGNAKPAAETPTTASPQDTATSGGEGGTGGRAAAAGETENADGQAESAGPSARMVDPRAASSKKSRDGAEGRDGENVYRESDSSRVRRREDGDAEEDPAKRARMEEGSRRGETAGDSPPGIGVTDSGGCGGGGETQEQEREDDERTAEEKSAAEAEEKARKAASAKEKKEAAVKAARERFLARKKNP